MKLEDIDLMDLDRFWRREHDEMFTLLRKEDPVHMPITFTPGEKASAN